MAFAGRLHPTLILPITYLLLAVTAESAFLVLECHRWLGTAVAVFTVAAAVVARARSTTLYRVSLFTAAALLPIASHLGGVLVWGADSFKFQETVR